MVTALVVWDGLSPVEAGGTVDNYTVRVFNTSSGQDVTVSVRTVLSCGHMRYKLVLFTILYVCV